MTEVSIDRFARAFGMDAVGVQAEPFVWGTVTAVGSDGSYTVILGATTNTARAARLCHAAVGDRVLCAVRGGVLSAIGTAGGGVVPVSGGGTGATTAAAARSNIGAYGAGSFASLGAIELGYNVTSDNGGYVDFHYNGSSADYTSRIIEASSGTLTVYGNLSMASGYEILVNGKEVALEEDLGWTLAASHSGSSTKSVSLGGYNEVAVVYYPTVSGEVWLYSATIPIGMLSASSAKKMIVGGGYSGSGTHSLINAWLSTVTFTPGECYINGRNYVDSSYWKIYGR